MEGETNSPGDWGPSFCGEMKSPGEEATRCGLVSGVELRSRRDVSFRGRAVTTTLSSSSSSMASWPAVGAAPSLVFLGGVVGRVVFASWSASDADSCDSSSSSSPPRTCILEAIFPRGRRMASSSSELLSRAAKWLLCCWMRRVVAVVGDTLRERLFEVVLPAGDGDLDGAIVPAIERICREKIPRWVLFSQHSLSKNYCSRVWVE